MHRRIIQSLAGVVLFLAVILCVTLVRSRAAFETAESHLAEGQKDQAVASLESAIRWYFPGNPYARSAAQKLFLLARAEESAGRFKEAIGLYRRLSGSILATRHLWVPRHGVLESAIEAETRLLRGLPPSPDQEASFQSKAPDLGLRARTSHDPFIIGVLLLFAGLCSFLGGVGGLAFHGFGPDGVFRPQARRWGLITAAGVVLWVLGVLIS